MKALLEKHVRALELRSKGWSYSAIKKELGIAKSTASAWLNKYPLSHEQPVFAGMEFLANKY